MKITILTNSDFAIEKSQPSDKLMDNMVKKYAFRLIRFSMLERKDRNWTPIAEVRQNVSCRSRTASVMEWKFLKTD